MIADCLSVCFYVGLCLSKNSVLCMIDCIIKVVSMELCSMLILARTDTVFTHITADAKLSKLQCTDHCNAFEYVI